MSRHRTAPLSFVLPALAIMLFALSLALPSGAAAKSCLTPVASDDNEPPCNPFLSGDIWAASHRGSYAQASSPFPGPRPGDTISYEHQLGILGVPIVVDFTEQYEDGGRAVWFSVVATPDGETVYKADYETGQLIDQLGKQDEGQLPEPGSGGVSGAYNILDSKNRLIVARPGRLDVYADAVKGDRFSPIERLIKFELPAKALCGSEDKVVGITMLYDGSIAFATELGVVGTVPGNPKEMTAGSVKSISLNEGSCEGATLEDKSLDAVSNSIAADENGGIYVVTSKAMYKFAWDGKRLEQDWRTRYETGLGTGVRLGDGSGSTPSLMGTDAKDDRFVVITDGQELMHLDLIWRDRIPKDWKGLDGRPRRIACEVPVTFGDPNATESLSEQSVMVRGNSAIVVNNKLQNEAIFEGLPPNQRIIAAALAGQDPENAPYGIERIDWNPKKRTCSVKWVNEEISIPNGIPSMSTATNLVYGIGQRGGHWGLEGLDFDTGKSKLWAPSSNLPTDNSFYAATTVGPDGSVWTGTFTGFTVFRSADPLPAPELACKDIDPPTSRIDGKRTKIKTGGGAVRGKARDKACGERSARTLKGVTVSVALKQGKRCSYLLGRGELSDPRKCGSERWLKAKTRKGGRFQLKLPKGLPGGRYLVNSRATDRTFNRESPGKVSRKRI